MAKNDMPGKWQTTDSKYLVNDRWLKLRADTFVTPEGITIAPWYVMEYSDWVNCVVIDDDLQVLLLRHYRPAVDEYVLEIVSGMMDPGDASPEQAITRELAEEIGWQGGELYQTGATYPNPATHSNQAFSFLAIGGRASENTAIEDAESFVRHKMPFAEFVDMFTDPSGKELSQALHVSSVFFALNFIRRSDVATPAIRRLRELL